MNKEGNKPDNFANYINTEDPEKGPDYKNVDEQDDLTRFDKVFKKKKRTNSKKRRSFQKKAKKN